MDITKEWTKKENVGQIINRQEYIIKGTTYRVDGHHVILAPTSVEVKVAEILAYKYGKKVELIPQIMYPAGMQTPDYLIDGDRFDLKSPTGKGKNLLYGMIAKKKQQAHCFVINLTCCPLGMDEIERQTNDLFRSPRTAFLDIIVFIKGDEIVKVVKR